MPPLTVSIPSDTLTITLYCVEIISCITALILLIMFAVFIRGVAIVHRNLRILVINQTFAFMLMSIARCIIDLGVLANVVGASFGHGSNTVIRQNFYLCKMMTIVYDLSMLDAVLIFFLMALERTFASYYVFSYENASTKLGYALVAVSWILALIQTTWSIWTEITSGSIWTQFFNRPNEALTCAQTLLAPTALLWTVMAITTLNIVSLMFYVIVLMINKRRYLAVLNSRGDHSLSERFQIIEIIKSMRLLAPSIICLFIEYTISTSLVVVIDLSVQGNQANEMEIVALWNFEQLYTLSGILYALSEPMVRILSHPNIRRRFCKALRISVIKLSARAEPDDIAIPNIDDQQQQQRHVIPNIDDQQRQHQPKALVQPTRRMVAPNASGRREAERTEEQTVYFKALNKTWGTAGGRHVHLRVK